MISRDRPVKPGDDEGLPGDDEELPCDEGLPDDDEELPCDEGLPDDDNGLPSYVSLSETRVITIPKNIRESVITSNHTLQRKTLNGVLQSARFVILAKAGIRGYANRFY